jgi:hypothetical protein
MSALGHKQTYAPQKSHVRFTPESRHSPCKTNVRYVPEADIKNIVRHHFESCTR